jgi:release factor glutamine methyltransferase
MKTLGEVLNLSTEFLTKKNIGHARRVAEELLSSVVSMPRIELYMQFDRPLTDIEIISYRSAIKQKGLGVPWQYIVGEVEFLNAQIKVDPSVLIPRQETEILVSKILEQEKKENLDVWDLCTGSGCIGVALKKAKPSWNVTVSDISFEALVIAKLNIESNQVDVNTVQGDFLNPFKGKKADIIICNPPYISESEYSQLDIEVLKEPKIALVGGVTGYEYYERLARELPNLLNPNAKIFLEIGTGMGETILNLFSNSHWSEKNLLTDWAGHTRFIFLEYDTNL